MPHTIPDLPALVATLGLPADEIIRRADGHTISVQAWLSSRAPGAERFAGQGVRASSTGLRVPLLNLALGCAFAPHAPDSVVEAEISAVQAFFAARGVPWYWWIGPHPRPADIAQRLYEHGIRDDGRPLPAMAAPLPRPALPPNPAITVWEAANAADLAAASTIRRVAFRFPEGVATNYFEAMASSWLAGDPARLFLARVGHGPAAAIGALIMGEGLPGVYVMATLPEWERQGLGRAILARIMAEASADGHRMLTLTASQYGFPLYQQCGFAHIFDYSIYQSG